MAMLSGENLEWTRKTEAIEFVGINSKESERNAFTAIARMVFTPEGLKKLAGG
ncbi:MAG: hypothetical protein JWM11_7892 [Planctomycetaceae bacterium]|nr:hypothetical protein [Planctomycetaceae bacterium]